MRYLIHNAALDLLNAGLSVDDDIVEAVLQNADDFLQVGIDLAVAAGAFRSADAEKCKAGHFDQCVKDLESRFAQKLKRLSCFAVFDAVNNAHADIVKRELNVNSESDRQADSRVCIYREDLLIREIFHQKPYDRRRNRRLADTAFTGDRDDLCFIFQ